MKFYNICGVVLTVAVGAMAAPIVEQEANDSIAGAQNIDSHFTLDFNDDIADVNGDNTSTLYPHVSISGNGNSEPFSKDFFRFTVPDAGLVGIFDIDYGAFEFDSWLELYDASGNLLADNDDHFTNAGGSGSETTGFALEGAVSIDSFIQYTFADAGEYIIGVSGWRLGAPPSEVIFPGQDYVLQVSVQDHAVQEPVNTPDAGSSLLLLSLATGTLLTVRRVTIRK